MVNENQVEDIRFESEDGITSVELTRQKLEEPGIYLSQENCYKAERFMVEHNGHIDCITTSNKLEYKNTHHNFSDTLIGSTELHQYKLEMSRVGVNTWRNTISKLDIATSDIIWGPIKVIRK